MVPTIIVGNGITGVTAAQAIARAEPGTAVHIYAAEPHLTYRRPQLPAYIAGEVAAAAITHRPPAWYEEQNIHLHLGCPVAELDAPAHRLRLEDGTSIPYQRLLLATGGRAWMPPVEGAALEGVFTLRTLDDARTIRARARHVRRAVVVGGGILGLEIARALRALGLAVTVLELSDHLMPRQLDREGGAVLQGILEEMGIHVLTQSATAAILGNGEVSGVQLKEGGRIPTDLVVCATGWRPVVELAQQAGLTVDRGVVVDEYLQTSAEDVYAAGDVAEVGGRLYGIIPPAIEQARVAGANMASPGSATYTSTLPSTTLKVAGAELTSLGKCVVDDTQLLQLRHVDLERRHYRKFVVEEGRIVGAILLNERARTPAVRRLIREGVDVSAHTSQLLDDDFDLTSLSTKQVAALP